MRTRKIAAAGLAILTASLPTVAEAYVGPGAGLSLAAAFWAILVALATIVAFTLMWPVRRLLRRRGSSGPQRDPARTEVSPDPDGMAHGRGGHGR